MIQYLQIKLIAPPPLVMAEPVTPLILSPSYLQCNAYIGQGADVDVDAFLEWLAEHKDGKASPNDYSSYS